MKFSFVFLKENFNGSTCMKFLTVLKLRRYMKDEETCSISKLLKKKIYEKSNKTTNAAQELSRS